MPKNKSKKTSSRPAKQPAKKTAPTPAKPLISKNSDSRVQTKSETKLPLTKVLQPDADALKKLAPQLAKVRAHVRESFGKIVMSMMLLPRYRSLTIADLQLVLLEPLTRDRVALAYPSNVEHSGLSDLMGVAIWAAVSEEADARIREQTKAGKFPVRLKPSDWNSGKIVWLLDVIAPDPKTASLVISNFSKVVKTGSLRMHPLISKMVDEDMRKRLKTKKSSSTGPKV